MKNMNRLRFYAATAERPKLRSGGIAGVMAVMLALAPFAGAAPVSPAAGAVEPAQLTDTVTASDVLQALASVPEELIAEAAE